MCSKSLFFSFLQQVSNTAMSRSCEKLLCELDSPLSTSAGADAHSRWKTQPLPHADVKHGYLQVKANFVA